MDAKYLANNDPDVSSRKEKISTRKESKKWQRITKTKKQRASERKELIRQWDKNMAEVNLTKEADAEDISTAVTSFDEEILNAKRKEMLKIVQQRNRVAYPRQLGDWITVDVDGPTKSIRCNCKRCNRCDKCSCVAALEVTQFNVVPPDECKMAHG